MSHEVLNDRQFAEVSNTFVGGFAGATRELRSGSRTQAGDRAFVVGIPGHSSDVTGRELTESDVRAHRESLLADPDVGRDVNAAQGSWTRDPAHSDPPPPRRVTTLDRAAVFGYADNPARPFGPGTRAERQGAAVVLGAKHGEEAIYDAARNADVATSGISWLRGSAVDADAPVPRGRLTPLPRDLADAPRRWQWTA